MSVSTGNDTATIYNRPVELLQNLIRFNTTNPPGNEGECINYINHLLKEAGIETTILARDPVRTNLIARLSGQGNAPPLLLQGHVDVVTTENQTWQHPPFEGKVVDGFVWGRGALDMKGGVAIMLAAFLRAKAEGLEPPGDVILAIVSDEEKGGEFGARYLVENHAAQFADVRYAIGEIGGFSFYVGKQKFYPIGVAEKGLCRIEVTLRGQGGHPTGTYHAGAMAKLGKLLQQLDREHLPVHITPATRQMIQTMSSALPFPANLVLRQLLNPRLTDGVLRVIGKQVEQFEALLHNTVNATTITGADVPNRIPDKIAVNLVFCLLPGYTPEDAVSELRQLVGKDAEIKVVETRFYEKLPVEPDMGLFGVLSNILREVDPEGVPAPLVLPGSTDGRLFSRLGIQTYGFLPMNLPDDFFFWQLMHGPDERIPVEALPFGADAIYKVLQRFGIRDGGNTITSKRA
jgi:acetylornithine deacetylase/succinyl-diaminopimelate desuccinylase-like protein